MASHIVVDTGPEPKLLVRASRGQLSGGAWDIENLSETSTVYVGHDKVATSGENRGWSIAPRTRARVDLLSGLYVVSDEAADVLAFKSSCDGPAV